MRDLEHKVPAVVLAPVHAEGSGAPYEERRTQTAQRDVDATRASILNALPAHIALLNDEGTIIAVNDGWCRFGKQNGSSSEVFELHQNYLQVCDEARGAGAEGAAEAASGIRSVLSGEASEFSMEYACHAPDGRRWFRLTVTRMEDGAHPAAVVMHLDVTERVLGEQALRESEERFRTTFEQSGVGVALVSLNGHFLKVNPALCQMLGFAAGDLIGWTFQELTHPEDLAADLEEIRALLSGARRSFQMEKRYLHRDGHPVWALLNVSLVRDDTGAAVHFISQIQNITERRQDQDELRLQAHMLDQIGQAVIATDPLGSIIYANRFAGELYGWTPAEVLGCALLNVTVPQISLEEATTIMACLQRGENWSGEMLVQARDGRIFPASVTNSPLFDPQGRLIGIVGISSDISARKEAEQTSQQNEQDQRTLAAELEAERARLLTAQAVAKVGSWETNLATMEVIWSEETHRIFETDPRFRATHEAFLRRIHPDDRAAVDEAFERSLHEGASRSIEHRVQFPDGRIKHIQERWQVFTDHGVPVRAVGTAQDVTERVEREQELSRTYAHIQEQASMLDEATDAIFVCDLSRRITYWNRSAERLYGWPALEAMAMSSGDLLHDSTDPAFAEAGEVTLRTGQWSGDLRKRTREGREIIVESRWTLLREDAGRPRAILTISSDITERRRLEAQFLRAQRMESIGTLAGGIAHDLNNLLAPIVMGVSVLKRFEEREKILAVIENIERSARRGTDLVRQVLSFGKGVDGARVPIRLADVVKEIETIIASTFPKAITLHRSVPANLPLIVGDPTQMNQVLLNLCVNARDAMAGNVNGGRLTLSVQTASIDQQYAAMNRAAAAGRYVVLEVADEGCGMPPEVMDRAFDPFFTTKDSGKGTGLGLSTVNGIVRSHGGFVNVTSEVGRGSSFQVYLPVAGAHVHTQDDAGTPDLLPRGEGELVLIVDDEAPILRITSQTLETFGYRTMVAEDGAQAIGMYAMHRDEIALVITDMMMPVMDGPALIAALQRIDPAVKIIAASGVIGDLPARAGLLHFLAKPFSAEVMLTLIRKVLDTVPAAGEAS